MRHSGARVTTSCRMQYYREHPAQSGERAERGRGPSEKAVAKKNPARRRGWNGSSHFDPVDRCQLRTGRGLKTIENRPARGFCLEMRTGGSRDHEHLCLAAGTQEPGSAAPAECVEARVSVHVVPFLTTSVS